MTITISGVLMRHDGMGACYDDYGRLVDAHRLDVADLTLGADHVPVDLDHNGDPVGELVFIERTPEGDVLAVAVADDVDELLEFTDPIYFSSVTRSTTSEPDSLCWHGRRPVLLGVGLTFEPGALGLSPVSVRKGDVRKDYDRYYWPMSWRSSSPLLVRASEMAGTCTRPARLQLHDRRPMLPQTAEKTSAVSTPSTWSPRRIEYRSASAADVQRARRIIDIVAVPHDTPTTIYERGRTITETIVRGAFASVTGRDRRIPVNRDHVTERLVGQAKNLDPHNPVGLVGELHIARTALGDETLALAEDGVLDASVGFVIPAGGSTEDNRTRRVHRAELLHIALTPEPAYPTANVLDVRGLTV